MRKKGPKIATVKPNAESEQLLDQSLAGVVMNSLPGVFYIFDREGKLVRWNDEFARLTGVTVETAGMHRLSDRVVADDKDKVRAAVETAYVQGRADVEAYVATTHGLRFFHLVARRLQIGDQPYIVGAGYDITGRKKFEEKLQGSETYRRMMFESARDAILIMRNEIFVDCNPAALALFGAERDSLIGKVPYDKFSPELQPDGRRSKDSALAKIEAALKGTPQFFEWQHRKLDGELFDVEVSLNQVEIGKETFLQSIVRDITVRKRVEDELRHLNRRLLAISACNELLVRADEEHALLGGICNIICEQGGYRMAWVGFAENDEAKTVRPVAWTGVEDGYLSFAGISWADTERGRGPAGAAIRNAQTVYIQDFSTDPRLMPWRDAALQRGYHSTIGLPLRDKGRNPFGVLVIYALEKNAFTVGEIRLLEEFAGDLAFGIGALRSRAAQKRAEEGLKKALNDTIVTMAKIGELRDPYTAGHQQRVASLAIAIAREMNLEELNIDELQMAAIIHDIGKINVPADILSKPGKLNNLEMQLIMSHAQSGYEIVSNMNLLPEVAQIIWQHHERLDGSGYPRGLKGDQILPGARILCVADVVEAMASHRPYRAALGIDVALAEISRNSGKYYDPDVCNACLRLFREKKFQFRANGISDADSRHGTLSETFNN